MAVVVTQREAILACLAEAKSITPMEALMKFGCFRLGARIHELRNAGYLIDTEYMTDDYGKTYARYKYRGHHAVVQGEK